MSAEFIPKFEPASNPTQPTFLSPGMDSSAKKYTTADSVENNDPTDSTSNIEHIVNIGAAAKSLSLAVQGIAAEAQRSIVSSVAAVLQVDGVTRPPVRQSFVNFDESDVNSLQRAMAAAAAQSFNSVSDPNIRALLQRRTGLFLFNSRHAFVPVRAEGATVRTVNLSIPEMEEVNVDINPRPLAVDNFHVALLYNLPTSELDDIRAIRVFRADISDPAYVRPLATLSPNGIQRIQAYRGRKNQDFSQNQMQLEANGVPNAVANLNFFDPFTGQRVSFNGDTSLVVPPELPGQNPNIQFIGTNIPEALSHLDTSVLSNINVLANIQKNPIYGFDVGVSTSGVVGGTNVNQGLRLGIQQQIQVQENRSTGKVIIGQNNKLEFACIAIFSPGDARANMRRVGDRAEFLFDDESVSYGKGYKYFIVSVDNELQQSARSIVASVVVEGLRVPERPRLVVTNVGQTTVSLSIVVDDQLVEKFEVYRFEDDVNRATKASVQTIADNLGFTQKEYARALSSNDFLLIGECINPMKLGAQFTDTSVIPGRHYTYRVYSVDIFGNKSESPFELESFIPDLEQQFIDLRAPSVLAEVDSKTHSVRFTFRCDDEHLDRVHLERRDLTIGQSGFTTPGEPPRPIFGYGRSVVDRKYLEGEHLYDQNGDVVWNGIFTPVHHADQVFIDRTVALDHVYQYRAYGEDRYGNRSSYALTSPLLVNRRPFVNAPTGLKAEVLSGSDTLIEGFQVSWVEANLDRSAEDLIGSQASLANTSVRTLYQLQRLKQGEQTWRNFSLVSGTSVFDPVVGVEADVAPNFRPPYLEPNQTYFYRVQAVQTGVFISNFSEPVQVFSGYGVGQPRNFVLRTPPVYLRPFYAMLNWDTQRNSGVVDHWEIQRAVINNLAAARLNLKNPDDYKNLDFRNYKTIFRESSRFSSKVQDDANVSASLQSNIVVGEHNFMDTQVDFGNTYFYRIRAVSPGRHTSPWSYKGIRMTSAVFEQKWIPALTDAEKAKLSTTYEPLVFINGRRPIAKSTLSLQPEFSKSNWTRAAPKVSIEVTE